ncbi:hypothetical protein HOY80DRAFT_961401 [Tuber brumale]|nr:hypothetical protein HOY80DRAFT_961401 [Tuber brumale]
MHDWRRLWTTTALQCWQSTVAQGEGFPLNVWGSDANIIYQYTSISLIESRRRCFAHKHSGPNLLDKISYRIRHADVLC